MRRYLMLLMALLIAFLPAAAEEIEIQPEGYTYCGYMPGGITFLMPENMVSYALYEAEKQAGILIYAESRNCSIQLRRFEPDQMTMPQFLQMVQQAPNTYWEVSEERGTPVLCYRNLAATASTELLGVVITGTDGCMYKVSIFSGWDENVAEDAPVWEIAQVVADSLRHEDFSFFPGAE